MQDLIKISKNSIFWSLKRTKSLFDIVKLRKDPSEFYFLNPKSLFPQGDPKKKKKTLMPSQIFLSNLFKAHRKNKKKTEISLLTSSKQSEFEIITTLYEKVIDNTYDLQNLSNRKNSESQLLKKFLRQESLRKSPRHNQILPDNFKNFSLKEFNEKTSKDSKEEFSSFGEALKKEEVKLKKSDFFKLVPLIKIQKEKINKEENEGSSKEMETNSITDFKSQMNPKLKIQEKIDKGNFLLDPRILVQRELEGAVFNPS